MASMSDVVVIGAGQSALAAARALQAHGITAVVLEAGPEPAGSWPRYLSYTLPLASPWDAVQAGAQAWVKAAAR
jgi:putative flavoprotein involved in K+ transport